MTKKEDIIEIQEYKPTQEELNRQFNTDINNLKQKTDRIYLHFVIVSVIILGLMLAMGMLR